MTSLRKQITLCTVGTIFEWYDFCLFASLTPILSQIFFQHSSHFTALMSTFVIFASGYLMRPLGAIFFGHLGDKFGRKYALLITIFLMTVATTAIGLIPTGASFSTFLLVICRLVQGFATSGEYPGALTLLSEQQHATRKSFISSFGVFGTGAGVFSGALVYVVLLNLLGYDKMLEWGWRIPFLLGAPLGIIGYYLRKSIFESAEFSRLRQKGLVANQPIIKLFRYQWKTLLSIFGISILGNTLVYINFMYYGNYLLSLHKLTPTEVMYLNLIVTFVYSAAILIFGFLADLIPKKRILQCAHILILVLAYPLIFVILHGSMAQQFCAQMIISFLIGMAFGPFASILPEQFPTAVRYSGLSVILNFGAAFFGGSAPIVCGWLSTMTHNPLSPAFYVILLATYATIGTFLVKSLPEKEAVPLDAITSTPR